MNFETIMKLGKPTDRQIISYCKKNAIDYNFVFVQYGDFATMEKVLNKIEKTNLAKHNIRTIN